MSGSKMPGRSLREISFIQFILVKGDTKGMEIPMPQHLRECQQARTVDSATQEEPNRHIADEMPFDRIQQRGAYSGNWIKV